MEAAYVPARQATVPVSALLGMVPLAANRHDDMPAVDWYEPGGHVTHAAAPEDAEKLPAGHVPHAASPAVAAN